MSIPQATKVIRPTALTDSMLVSSTVAEADYPVWSADTTYAIDAKVMLNHRCYNSLRATNLNFNPATDTTTPAYWQDIGPTNQRAMFDDVVGTATVGASTLTVVVNPGSVSGVALLDVVGRTATVTLKAATGGAEVYRRDVDLDGTILESIYDWFFQPFEQRDIVVLTDLPFHYTASELTVSISATSGNASCGVCKFGEVIGIGSSLYNATSGIIDYSRKEADTWGNYAIVKRAYSKRMTLNIVTEKADYNRLSRALASLRSTPAVWIATDAYGYEPLTVYGFYKDFSIDVAYPTMHYCSLEIEGLV